MPDKTELRIAAKVLKIRLAAGDEVIHADNLVAFREKPITEMGTDEPGAARDYRPQNRTSRQHRHCPPLPTYRDTASWANRDCKSVCPRYATTQSEYYLL
jgi:hypothetical protein